MKKRAALTQNPSVVNAPLRISLKRAAADRGTRYGEGLTDSGVRQIISRLGHAAGITGIRCSPHTIRHTFALVMLSNGAHVFSVMQALGHTDVRTTQRYLYIAEAQLSEQHDRFGPVDNLHDRLPKRRRGTIGER